MESVVVTHAPVSSATTSSTSAAVVSSSSNNVKRTTASGTPVVSTGEAVTSTISFGVGNFHHIQQRNNKQHNICSSSCGSSTNNNNTQQHFASTSTSNSVPSSSTGSNNPIFVITSSSGGLSAGSAPVSNTSCSEGACPHSTANCNKNSSSSCSGNNYEMPSNASVVGGGSDTVVSSTSAVPGVSAHCREDDEEADATATSTSVASSIVTVNSSTTGSGRPSNPRQSTLTRSHAITLDEDSDSLGGAVGGTEEGEQELVHFLIDTCNKSAKDKNFVLRIEADLVQFVKDEKRLTLPFPQMSSYQRMLVHRMATLFDLDHNVDNSSGGNFVVVSKDLNNGESLRGRLPQFRFKELQSVSSQNDIATTSTSGGEGESPSHTSGGACIVSAHTSSASTTVSSTASISSASSKKILKREKPSGGSQADKKGSAATKTKSLEERTQDYHKARRRIFEDCGGSAGDSASLDTSISATSASSRKLNWSSTDSSEDRMYLKPPFPEGSNSKLIKVESFESASQKKSSNRDNRQMGKSHSFGGYEDTQQQQQQHQHHHYSGGRVRGGGGTNSSNHASSSMISCSSSSSLRSSSFSKQDSSSSTTSGSGQSPSGGTSSGYKSGSSGVFSERPLLPPPGVSGYYSCGPGSNGSVGISPTGVNTMSPCPPIPPAPPVPPHQSSLHTTLTPPTGTLMFAPASSFLQTHQATGHPQLHQPSASGMITMPQQSQQATNLSCGTGNSVEDTTSSSQQNSNQQVMFCCWAVADVNNVPPGAVIIDPSTGQAVKNTDGSQYFYDPQNPPKFIQTLPMITQQPPPPSTPQPQQQQPPTQQVSSTAGDLYSTSTSMYPAPILAGPPFAAYTHIPQHQQQQSQPPSQIVASPPQQTTTYMSLPAFIPSATSGGGFALQDAQQQQQQQQIQDLSGYFSQMSMGGRTAGAQVVYVPLEAISTSNSGACAGSTSVPPPVPQPMQQQQQDQQTSQQQQFYEVDAQGMQYNAAVQYNPNAGSAALQFQNPTHGTGYLIQQVVDTAGNGYYYGGNMVQAPTAPVPNAILPASGCSGTSATGANSGILPTHQLPTHHHGHQQRFKNWVVPPQQQQQHQNQQHVYNTQHGASSQHGSQQQSPSSSVVGTGSTIIIHPNCTPTAGLVPVPTILGHGQATSQQTSTSGSAFVPIGYHSAAGMSGMGHPSSSAGAGGVTSQQLPQTMLHTLVPGPVTQQPLSSSSYQAPTHPQQYSQQSSSSSSHHQSFVPPTHQQAHSAPPNPHQHRHQSSSSNSHPTNSNFHSGGHHRVLSLTSSNAAAAASQHQQQILFAAAAAAMAMSNNYSNFPTGGGTGARFAKGGGRGGVLQHASVTGAHVFRRGGGSGPRSFSKQQAQQQNSSK